MTDVGKLPGALDDPQVRVVAFGPAVVRLFPRKRATTRARHEDDPEYVPAGPPDWARVVVIG